MKSIREYLESNSRMYPDRIALEDEKYRITYDNYHKLAIAVALKLTEEAKACGTVGVVAARNVFTPVLFMSVLYAGGTYVPVDPDWPKARQEQVMQDAGVELLISEEYIGDDLINLNGNEVVVRNPEVKLQTSIKDMTAEPMYIVYTSGSTGKPKGIVKSQGSMISFLESFARRYVSGEHKVIGNQTKFSFDASAKDIYLSVKYAATMQIIPERLFSFPVPLIEYLNQKKVTTIFWVPRALALVAELGGLAEIKPETLCEVFFVGEHMAVKHLKIWMEALPGTRFVNMYGFSEIAGVCCCYDIDCDIAQQSIIPVGTVLDNSEVVIRDGELYVASEALFDTYTDREYNTSLIKISDDGKKERLYYRTGDMAYYDRQGNIVVTGRKDYQIKHMGYRIELEEIEHCCMELECVKECGCVYDNSKMRIILFCSCEVGADASYIRKELSKKLPAYMVPKVLLMDCIPRTSSGKVDRVFLAQNLL